MLVVSAQIFIIYDDRTEILMRFLRFILRYRMCFANFQLMLSRCDVYWIILDLMGYWSVMECVKYFETLIKTFGDLFSFIFYWLVFERQAVPAEKPFISPSICM